MGYRCVGAGIRGRWVRGVARLGRHSRGRVQGAGAWHREAVQQQNQGQQGAERDHADSLRPPYRLRKRGAAAAVASDTPI